MGLPKLLITGSHGKIGKVLIRGLSDCFEIYGVDIGGDYGENMFRADISNFEQVDRLLQKIAPLSCLIHLAGDSRVTADWESVLRNNIIGAKNIYEAAKANRVERVIFASSNHVTGFYERDPLSLWSLSENKVITIRDAVRPDGDYAVSKIFGEAIARQYCDLYGIKSICLRVGTVLADDNPKNNDRHRRTWLSHRDLIQLVKKSIFSDVKFGIYYGVSDNKDRFWDISNAKKELDYAPEDDASTL